MGGCQSLDVVIPSRNQPQQGVFLEKAVRSIETQTILSALNVRILIAADPGVQSSVIPVSDRCSIRVLEADRPSQASALNAGLSVAEASYVAFLEDDDQWEPPFLEVALPSLQQLSSSGRSLGLVSSTQLEVDSSGDVERVNDFATPSGWLTTSSTLKAVGPFDSSFRWHLDNDWLGRAFAQRVPRLHWVESTAPLKPQHLAQVRPWLLKVLQLSGGTCQLRRHHCPTPLIRRLVHPGSGMAQIAMDPERQKQSRDEQARLRSLYGRCPW